eukprot:TRINITY_DN9771_c0_g1_i2.p1 TRINITY_DN9771_c0_g1~~TRINITY_DN9771_c0_g1_i2.p1  ORF type:complete len:164 (-),score=8.71 TRINITY_DN9771_c0_g1_i2:113-604(-)
MDCTFPGTADERSSGSLLFPQANTAPRLDRTQRQNPHLLTSSCTGLFEKGLAPRWIELQQQQNPSGLPAGDRGGSSGARRYLYWKLQRASEEEGQPEPWDESPIVSHLQCQHHSVFTNPCNVRTHCHQRAPVPVRSILCVLHSRPTVGYEVYCVIRTMQPVYK